MNYTEACGILGVSQNDDLDSIKKKYRSKIKFYHPDNFQDDKEKLDYAEQMTKNLNEAWNYIEQNYETINSAPNTEGNNTYRQSYTAQNTTAATSEIKFPKRLKVIGTAMFVSFLLYFAFGVLSSCLGSGSDSAAEFILSLFLSVIIAVLQSVYTVCIGVGVYYAFKFAWNTIYLWSLFLLVIVLGIGCLIGTPMTIVILIKDYVGYRRLKSSINART